MLTNSLMPKNYVIYTIISVVSPTHPQTSNINPKPNCMSPFIEEGPQKR